jgi:hypothetical protein
MIAWLKAQALRLGTNRPASSHTLRSVGLARAE